MDSNKVFAYGSLVNSRARPSQVSVMQAVLPGWVRQWRHCIRTLRGNACALTVDRDTSTEIRGLLMLGNPETLEELNRREIGYSKVLAVARLDGVLNETDCYVYVGAPEYSRRASGEFPIWRSYLDCVLAGYLELGGRQAADDFIRTTRGWDVAILDDRGNPGYPRAVTLSSEETGEIDSILARHGLLDNLVEAGGPPKRH